MTHPFLERISGQLATRGIATIRFQFPYMEHGRGRPDRPLLAHATIRAAITAATRLCPGLPLFAGGKSFGGRMTSQALAAAPDAAVRGVIFLGFPLHGAKQPSTTRAAHLTAVTVPMLFIQGTRDALADLRRLRPVIRRLGRRATLVTIRDADHAFHVPARSGRTDDDVGEEIAEAVSAWTKSCLTRSGGLYAVNKNR